MSRPVLLAVAHGSRDPAAQETMLTLAGQVRALSPGVDVRAAFVQDADPSLADALAASLAGPRQSEDHSSGTGQPNRERRAGVVIIPLLLSAGYHLDHDITGAAGRAGVPVAAPLGPDQRLVTVLAHRLAEAGAPAGTPVVLAAAGSRDPRAGADAENQAALLAAYLRVPVLVAFASAARPTVDEAVAALAARTARPVAVATYLLAPGSFHRRLRRSAAGWVSEPLGGHPALAALVLDRYHATCATAGTCPG